MSGWTRPRASSTEILPISSEELAHCRRDRDFTNVLDIQNCWHTGFLRKLREHGHNSPFLWEDLQESEHARSQCIDSFLDIYGMEYWGDQEKRVKYLMPDSIARDDVLKYPENRTQLKDTLVLLLKKKADDFLKKGDGFRQSQSRIETALPTSEEKPTPNKFAPVKSIAVKRLTSEDLEFLLEEHEGSGEGENTTRASTNRDKEKTEAEVPPSPVFVPMSQNMSMTEPTPIPVVPTNITSTTTTRHYRHDTFFLITTDGPRPTAAAWHKYKDFNAASSFILHMGRARGLESLWWTAEAQMMIDGQNGFGQADYVHAAKYVIAEASITLEWSGETILVRWDNNTDWHVVRQMVHKAWMIRELGFQMIDVFKVKVLLHLH
ncbi:hypothetical protein BJX63DRAFT_424832 [Aspergillus granulosus]|uniref:Uncharacterized protein n=1 Tax=Aspergillus granulosus TaxID=176169 RepID=A0ABR4GY42_9EURO